VSKREGRGKAEITLVPDGAVVRGAIGASILRVLQECNVQIESSCGGNGTCGRCRIRFLTRPPEPTAHDLAQIDSADIARGWRLACAHTLRGDIRIEVASTTGELDQKATESPAPPVGELNPPVRLRAVRWTAPSREDPRPLATRLAVAVDACPPRFPPTLARLPGILRSDGTISVIEQADGILDVRPGEDAKVCGLAIDVGTTTLALHLVDLASGRTLGRAAARNPQRRFGADVISRIAHVRRTPADGVPDLHAAVVDGLNALAATLAKTAKITPEEIYHATVVGNPTMLHLLLGIDPRGIDVAPYAPVFTARTSCRASDLGLRLHPCALVETLPGVSAYVGADIVGGLLETALDRRPGRSLYLDIGTNGEIVLALDGHLIACSTAAGPAFEGASIVQGMAALHGAIESVSIGDGRITCDVIGKTAARGMCGTGLLSAVAELRAVGAIDPSGRFDASNQHLSDRFDGEGATRRFRLTDGAEPVYLYQSDVREFQLAKAAIRTGIETLLRRAHVDAERLDAVLIGGAFSAGLSRRHLPATGLVPTLDPDRIELVGDAAGRGAVRVLLDARLAEAVDRLAETVEYVELSGDREFSDLFVKHIPFPPGPADRSPASIDESRTPTDGRA